MAVGRTHPVILNSGSGQSPLVANITNSSTKIIAANTNRKWCIMTNIGNRDVYCAIGQAAEDGKGFLLGKNGGSKELDSSVHSTEVVNGITSAGSSNVIVQEGI